MSLILDDSVTRSPPETAAPDLPQEGDSSRPALLGDPEAPTQLQLLAAGYPRRPPSGSSAYSDWLRVVSKPSRLLPARLIEHPGTFNGGGSRNWSGYILTQGGAPYAEVYASWYVPALARGTGRESEWVGLDTDDVIQDGVTGVSSCTCYRCVCPLTAYYAWIEYVPNSEVQVSNLSVQQGDEIFAESWVGDSAGNENPSGGYGWFFVYNYRTAVSYQGSIAKPSGAPSFSGSSAEWIIEDPMVDGGYAWLADYGTASIFNIAAQKYQDGTLRDLATDSSVNVVMEDGTSVMSTAVLQTARQIQFTWHAPF